MKKDGQTFEQHVATGRALKRVQEALNALSVELDRAYPRNFPFVKEVRKAQGAVDKARCLGDSLLFEECGRDNFDMNVYYGETDYYPEKGDSDPAPFKGGVFT